MFRKILVGLDTSDMHRHVFEESVAIAKANHSKLMLLHILSPEEEGSPGLALYAGPSVYPVPDEAYLAAYRQQWDDYEKQGLQFLQTLTDEATEKGVSTEFTQDFGNAGQRIRQMAKTWDADLIVLGRRGRSGLTELFLGSVSNYVMHHSKCSVLIVQGDTTHQSADSQSDKEETTSASG